MPRSLMNALPRRSCCRIFFDFASTLGTAIQAHDNGIITLTVAAVGGDLNYLMDRIPEQGAPGVSGGEKERDAAAML